MSNNNATKKFSRRKAGNYGRPGSKAQKRIASKSARRFNAISVEDAFTRDSNVDPMAASAEEIAEMDAQYEREYEESGALDRDIEMMIEQEREDRLGSISDSQYDQMTNGGRA